MGRIESFNQRAGVLLAASLALTAIGAPLAADRFRGLLSIVALALVVIPFCVPVVLASMVLSVRTAHGIGPKAIRAYLNDEGRPCGDRGEHIHAELLNWLCAQPKPATPSVLDGLNNEADRKGSLLNGTQITFVCAAVASSIGLIMLTLAVSAFHLLKGTL